jgi:hypothetical protein
LMNRKVAVSIMVHGHPRYFLSGRHSVRSTLHHTDFDIYLLLGRSKACRFPNNRRINTVYIDELDAVQHRSKSFLLKFIGLKQCIEGGSYDLVIQMDADALFASPISAEDLYESLGAFQMGMVEQKTIKGTGMNRIDFYNHYLQYSLPLIDPGQAPPALEKFRFYNSGFVVGRAGEMYRLAVWALRRIEELENLGIPSQIGKHMIADQDYFQYWVNNLHPDSCVELPWIWNHCELWDEQFPRPEARVVHFSNYCRGPSKGRLKQIEDFSRSRFPGEPFERVTDRLKKIARRFR